MTLQRHGSDSGTAAHGMTLCDQNLGVLIGRARRGLRREFESRLNRYDLTAPQVGVLMALWHEDGQAIRSLLETVWSDGPTLTSLLDRLEAKDLIQRERDADDRRSVRIFLRPRGRELESAVMQAGAGVMEVVRSGMTQEEVDQLSTLLVQLCQTVERAHAASSMLRDSDSTEGSLVEECHAD